MYKSRAKKSLIIFLSIFMIILVLVGCANESTESSETTVPANDNSILETPYKDTQFHMGTYVSLQVYDEGKEAVLAKAYNRVVELEEKLSSNQTDTEIAKINDNAGIQPIEVSEEVMELLVISSEYSALENSGFDYTIGAITDLWRIGFDDARIPESQEIEAILPLVDYRKVELDTDNSTVYLTEDGMKLDLGAIAKGYIADQIVEIFEENGVTTAIIDLGGNVIVMGNSPNREEGGWNVGVQDPFDNRGSYIGAINIKDKSIVTSGIYERYIEQNGEIYHHLMNPRTGYPFDNNLASVTIIAEHSTDADGLSTVVFGFGLEEGLEYVNNRDDVEAIFITKDSEVYLSEGIKDTFNITNEAFTLAN